MKSRKRVHQSTVILACLAVAAPFALAQQQEMISTGDVATPGVHIKANGTTDPDGLEAANATSRVLPILDPKRTDAQPTDALRVAGNGITTSDYFSVGGPAPYGYQFYAETATASKSTAFQLRSSFDGTSRSYIGNFGDYGTYIATNRDPQNGLFHETAASDASWAAQVVVGDAKPSRARLFSVANFPGGTEQFRFVIKYDGRVGIGTPSPGALLHVAGDVIVDGNIGAKYQDVAEWVAASSDLQAGTVVVLNPDRDNEVMLSSRAYDTTVAGVVSAQPGLILGEGAATKETIATMGRVRVRVDASRGSIAIGDLLVTSDRPGYAMKSVPVEVGGIAMHRPGTILGKALQPLAEGEGEILVLLSMQ